MKKTLVLSLCLSMLLVPNVSHAELISEEANIEYDIEENTDNEINIDNEILLDDEIDGEINFDEDNNINADGDIDTNENEDVDDSIDAESDADVVTNMDAGDGNDVDDANDADIDADVQKIKDSIMQVFYRIPHTIPISKLNDEQSALEDALSYFDTTFIEENNIEITISEFSAGVNGTKQHIYGDDGRYSIEAILPENNGTLRWFVGIDADDYKVPDDEIEEVTWSKDPEIDAYFKKYFKVLINVKNTGISMLKVNTAQQSMDYMMSLAPDGKENFFIFSGTDAFKKAIAGTKDNPSGQNGYFHILITVADKNTPHTMATMGRTVPILAVPYTSSSEPLQNSSNSGKGSSGSSSKIVLRPPYQSRDTAIINRSINAGTWKKDSNGWRLMMPIGSYASSRWAFINNKWYLFGQDGYMLTGWQKADGKWYLLNGDGGMLLGWQNRDGKWYYMDSSGAMLTDTTTPDGYKVNKNGEWIQ